MGCSDVEIQRMTPAKAMVLMEKRMDDLSIREMPIAHLACIYANNNRDPGDTNEGRPPAPFMPLDKFLTIRRSRHALAAKDEFQPGGSHNLLGARANRDDWVAWARGTQQRRKPHKA